MEEEVEEEEEKCTKMIVFTPTSGSFNAFYISVWLLLPLIIESKFVLLVIINRIIKYIN